MSDYEFQVPSDANASGRSFDGQELSLLSRVLESGTLNCTRGTMVPELERRFAELLGMPAGTAVSSGTAAVHCAVAAVDPEPGDEIISSPITDMGAIAPILFQTAIPVFADVDPDTYNITAETIERVITPRTRAVIVTHLFGNPADMGPILDLARRHRFAVIEDCAQAFLATYKGRQVGTMGDIGCFSLQQGKHITSGEGGLVVTRNEHFARRIRLFHDKAWGYGDPQPDHYFLAPNYRMTELQGAVALAQLDRLETFVRERQRMADRLTAALAAVPGVTPPRTTPGAGHVYWRYTVEVDEQAAGVSLAKLGSQLREAGIAALPRYIQKPAFECQVLRDQVTFGKSRFPFVGLNRPAVEYRREDFPNVYRALARMLVLGWNEKMDEAVVDFIAERFRAAVAASRWETHASTLVGENR